MSRSRALPRWTVLLVGGVGVVLVGLSFGLGWWQVHSESNPWTIAGKEYHFVATSTDLPGTEYRTQCWVNDSSMPGFGPICSRTGAAGFLNAYSSPFAPAPHILGLYETVADLIVVAAAVGAVGLAGGVLLSLLLGHRRGRGAIRAVAVAALLIAGGISVETPVYVMLGEPAAASADASGTGLATSAPSPAVSFWGSCGPPRSGACSGPNTTEAWGAGPGWYLSLLGGALMALAGLWVWRRPVAPPPPSPVAVANSLPAPHG